MVSHEVGTVLSTIDIALFCHTFWDLHCWFLLSLSSHLCILSLCKCVQMSSLFRVKSQLCKSIFTIPHKVLVVVLVDYCMAVCSSAMTACGESPKGFVMDLYGKIKPIFWRRKPAGALSQRASQGAFSFLNANSSTFPCCSVGKSCYPTSHPAQQLRNPERQAIGCNPAAGLKLRY